jgi:hypothetical protein
MRERMMHELARWYRRSQRQILETCRSEDGATKYLLALDDGLRIEAVFLRMDRDGKDSLCTSAQVGCAFSPTDSICDQTLSVRPASLYPWRQQANPAVEPSKLDGTAPAPFMPRIVM